MFVTPAYAQAAPGAVGATDFLVQLFPIFILVIIFWFLIFRPQQKKMKQHQQMLSAVRRGDTIVTSGGIVGKVTKVTEGEDLEAEIAQGVKVRVVRGMIAEVRSKPEPVADKS